MPAAALRDDLESLLRVRKLDHTSSIVHRRSSIVSTIAWTIADAIDGRLSPPASPISMHGSTAACRAAISPKSSARDRRAVSPFSCRRWPARPREGEAVALIDPLDMFDPVSASSSGIDFTRMLWVRGESSSSARVSLSCEYGTLQKSARSGGEGAESRAAGRRVRTCRCSIWARSRRRPLSGCLTPPGCACIGSSKAAKPRAC